MRCAKCGISVDKTNLIRINKLGVDGIFWCEPCTELYEPEIYSKFKEAETEVERDLKKFFYLNKGDKQ